MSATISLYRKRQKIHPRAVQGRFQRWRWFFVLLTQALFYGLPWLQWTTEQGSRQALLFDLEARRFFLFGWVLYPQDFIYLAGLLIVSALALFLFTAVAGRLWCGYSCPQTVYTSMFLWVEQRWEGSKAQREKLDRRPWRWNTLWRRAGKHASWLLIAVATGFSFVGYFTPIRELAPALWAAQLGPWQSFWIAFYSLATWGNAGFMREQVCLYMCPYARFQSAMFDKDTLIVAYDAARGEPRGPRGRGDDLQARGLGSCIDCRLCVDVCPTGIDIRQGLQYECIGCAACVDVCDGVMDKMGYARGLVRYDTENGLAQKLGRAALWRRVARPRVGVYGALLLLAGSLMLAGLLQRPPLRVDVLRDRASLGRWNEQGELENVYRLQLMNLQERPLRLRIRAESDAPELAGLRLRAGGNALLQPIETQGQALALALPQGSEGRMPAAGAYPLRVIVQTEDGPPLVEKTTFVIPR